MKKLLIVVLLSLTLCGCDKKECVNYQYTSDEKVEKLMQENEFLIVDVRTEEEFLEEHVKGAINIPYDMIDESTVLDNSKLIFVYCRSGARSKVAYTKLLDMGYNVYDLGGINTLDLEKE